MAQGSIGLSDCASTNDPIRIGGRELGGKRAAVLETVHRLGIFQYSMMMLGHVLFPYTSILGGEFGYQVGIQSCMISLCCNNPRGDLCTVMVACHSC